MNDGGDATDGGGGVGEGSPDKAGGIQVINRAARILRAVRDEGDGLSLGQIAERVDLPRSTVQRIVHALVEERLLMAASPNGRVRLGMEILALANSSKIDIVEIAHPHLKALSESTGETVDLAVLRKDHLVFVDQVAGSHRLRAVSAVGELFPLYCTANGKACLSLLEDSEIRQRLKNRELRIVGGKIRSVASLIDELKTVRRSGIAFDEEEHSSGISALGTAFRDQAGTIYAISIPAPTSRFKESREKVGPQLLATRDRMREILGT
jgi:DNA-binding IclR family transcriptional regulator